MSAKTFKKENIYVKKYVKLYIQGCNYQLKSYEARKKKMSDANIHMHK